MPKGDEEGRETLVSLRVKVSVTEASNSHSFHGFTGRKMEGEGGGLNGERMGE